MFVGECKLYIINIQNINSIHNGKKLFTNWEPNSLILNIGETPNKFYAIDNNGEITEVKLTDNNEG